MSELTSPAAALGEAKAALKADAAPAAVLQILAAITPDMAEYASAQHLRGVCTLRQGRPVEAAQLMRDAVQQGERSMGVFVSFAQATKAAGLPPANLAFLVDVLARVASQQVMPLLMQLLTALEFRAKATSPENAAIFDGLLLPLLRALLERREMDAALQLESLIYELYVKASETEAHFAHCMQQIEPLFTMAGHYWRDALPPLPAPGLGPPYRIGFFVHAASTLAHVEVLLNTLKGYRLLEEQPFEPVVYCYAGKSEDMEQALAALGVRLVMLKERFPETRDFPWQRLLRLRELLAEDGVQELVWVSVVLMLPLAFGLRIAPVQTWFAMKYRNFSQPDIDGYVTGSALTRYGTLAGRRWRMAMLGVDDWYDPALEARAAQVRRSLGDRVVLMTLARTEKMLDPTYLQAMVAVLQRNPQAMFLWAGREEQAEVVQAFREGGVLDRTRFIGWVNTRLFAQVADIFLDTFPFPCGFTLYQAMAARKPVVIYASPEAAQTGLWNFIKPLVDDGEGTPEERAELRAMVGDDNDPLIPVARHRQDYVRHASRLIADRDARARGGAAAHRFIARYFSDPAVMGRSLSDHFVELITSRRAQLAQ